MKTVDITGFFKKFCITTRTRKFLQENGFATEDELDAVDRRVQEELAEAVRFANESPLPTPESVVQDIYSDIVEEVRAR